MPTASAASALGLGRLVALSKPYTGGVQGIVVGDFLRRLVARTLARQFAPTFEAATNPHQYALSTRAGSEALVHSLQAACEGDPSFTVLSVDGVGAFDLIGRQAMLTALRDTPDANAILPFVRLFYGSPSEFVWADSASNPHSVLYRLKAASRVIRSCRPSSRSV